MGSGPRRACGAGTCTPGSGEQGCGSLRISTWAGQRAGFCLFGFAVADVGGAHSAPTYSGLRCTTGSLNEFVLFCCARLRTRPRVRGRGGQGVTGSQQRIPSRAQSPQPQTRPSLLAREPRGAGLESPQAKMGRGGGGVCGVGHELIKAAVSCPASCSSSPLTTRLVFLTPLLRFPGGIIWAVVPAVSKPRAEVEGTSGNSRLADPSYVEEGFALSPHLFPGLSISPEFGPGALEFEERNVLQLPPVDQFPLGCGKREFK